MSTKPIVWCRTAVFPVDMAMVRALFEAYAAEIEIDLSFQGFDEELAELPGRYIPPSGGLWLAATELGTAGCVAVRQLDPDVCELKRMFVRPECRGQGVGRQLAEHALTAAAELRYRRICLDTLYSMATAIDLYRSLGFTEIAPYYHNPAPGALFFGRALELV